MSADTKIEWADDSVSFWHGCTKIADGCKFCYADSLSKRFGLDVWGPEKPRLWIKSAEDELRKLDRKASKEGQPRMVFINSMSDFFEDHDGPVVDRHGERLLVCACGNRDSVPLNQGEAQPCSAGCGRRMRGERIEDLRLTAFRLFDELRWLRFLLLTKRPGNVRRMMGHWLHDRMGAGRESPDDAWQQGLPLSNVWLGASVSNQESADRLLHQLLDLRELFPVLFLSYEPALGPLRLQLDGYDPDGIPDEPGNYAIRDEIDWVIVGGESGPQARRCDVAWIRSMVYQCREAGVPCFVKQLGSHPTEGGDFHDKTGPVAGVRLRHPKGGDPDEWDDDLRVRQWPKTIQAVV